MVVTDRQAARVLPLHPADAASTGQPCGAPIPAQPAPIRVLIAESQTLVRAGYRALLESEGITEVVAEAASAEQAIALAAESRPDVALVDLALSGLDDPVATERFVGHAAFAGVAVILTASQRGDDRVRRALHSGAMGMLGKEAQPTELVRAVQVVARGQALFPVGVVRELLSELHAASRDQALPPGKLDELSEREREVVALVAGGLSNGEIADRLVISPATAKTHVSRAMLKLGARHRAQLVVLAYETGLVRPRWPAAN
jgi:DNA-binding NarL/FixJ family response regulator